MGARRRSRSGGRHRARDAPRQVEEAFVNRAAIFGAALVTFVAASALADDSEQGPLYIQGGVGVSYWDFPRVEFFGFFTGYSWTGFNPQIEAGYHFSGRHDGFVLGLRQAFIVTGLQGNAAGLTALRGGWDIAMKVSSFELNIDPFATIGIGYIFDGPHAGITATGGIDAKIFFGATGIYAFARPAELGIQCFHDVGECAFSYAATVGAGIALGKK